MSRPGSHYPQYSPIRAGCQNRVEPLMLCAAIDIGSNTTRILVAEPIDGQLKKVMEQRAYTRIAKSRTGDGAVGPDKVEEVADAVETQVRLAQELGAESFRAVATASLREAANGAEVAAMISDRCGIPLDIVTEEEEGRLAFLGATKALGHPVDGCVAVVDVGGGSSEIIHGTVASGVEGVRSWPVGSGVLADELISSDPPSASEIRRIRDQVEDIFSGVELAPADQAVAVGGTATSLRKIVGSRLEYETLERAMRLLSGDTAADLGRQFELDPVRVRILPTGVLILEKMAELLGQSLQIGKGGLREGIILDMLNGGVGSPSPVLTS